MKEKRRINVEDLERKQVFSVPDGYFEHLPGQIQHRLQSHSKETTLFAFSWLKYSISLAGLCMVIVLGYLFYNSSGNPSIQTDQMLAKVSDQEIVDYLQQAELSQYEVVDVASEANVTLDNDGLDDLEINNEMLLNEADRETIEDYI